MTSHAFSIVERPVTLVSRRRAILAMSAFAGLWALIEFVGALAIHRVLAWQVVFVRYSVHLVIVLALWGRHAPWRTRRLPAQLVRSAMMLIMPASFVFAASRGVSTAWFMTIFWSAPLLVLFFAHVVERERATASTWAAAALGWIAAWLYYAPEARPSHSAIVFGLGMAGSLALYIAMTRGLRHESLRTNLFYTAVVPWAALLPVMPRTWVLPSPTEFAALLFIGAAGWVVLFAVDRAADAAPVSDTAPMLYLQIGITMLLVGAFGHHEGLRRLAAFTVVLAATLALAWIGTQQSHVQASS
jgi:drug/metabolite transporter (DMT)-like permease